MVRTPCTALALALALVLALPAAAKAQEAPAAPEPVETSDGDEGDEPPATGGKKENDPTAVDKANDGTPRDFGGAGDGEGVGGVKADHHVVQTGDTLWDISGRYMGNPWYWPKVWSYNPEIENPHWIYPGDDVRFYPDDGRGDDGGPKRDLDDVSKGDFNRPDYGEDDDVTTAGNIGYRGAQSLLSRHDGFVTERELAESGVINGAFEEKDHISEGDKIYLVWPNRNNVKVNEQYVIYRTSRTVDHPSDGGQIGYLTEILGNVKVTAADPKETYVTAKVERSFGEIQRGDLIGPAGARGARRIARKPNQINLVGRILTSLVDGADHFGQWQLVFLDKGRRDGVEEGNTFEITRQGDGLSYDGLHPQHDGDSPVEIIGRVMVVDTKESASSAVLIYATRELHAGDRIQMRQTKK